MLRHCLSELMCIDFSEVVLHGCTYTVSAFLYKDITQFLVLKQGKLHEFFCTWVFINGRGSSLKIERKLIQDSARSMGAKRLYQSSFSWLEFLFGMLQGSLTIKIKFSFITDL